MYLSELKLWNFRRFGKNSALELDKPDLVVPFSTGLNVLIGENDSGKTAIIDAIKLVLKTHSFDWVRILWDDFYDKADRIRIEVRFDELLDEEAKNFTEWLSWEGEGGNAKPFLRLVYDVARNQKEFKIMPSDVRAGIVDDGYFLDAQAREYLKTTYLKPLRDAESELVAKKGSRLSQILLGHEAFKKQDQPHSLEQLFKETNLGVENYFDGKDHDGQELSDQKGKELKTLIDSFIKSFYDISKESEFKASDSRIKEILEKLELSIKDIYCAGLGTMNRLFMAAELLHLHKSNWSGVRLGLIEEIEAHLHPQAQMQIIEALEKIIKDLEKEKKQLQLILTTHSPNVASKVKLKNLLICNNKNIFPMGNDKTELDENDYEFLERFLDVTKSNLFFAKGIILVEGWSEEILIPALAKKIGINLTECGVSVVNIANTAFLRYSRIFKRRDGRLLDIPVAVITDLDEKPIASIIDKRSRLTSLQQKYDGQSVKTFVAPEWTLEYCLANSTSVGIQFQSIIKAIHSRTDWTNFNEALETKLVNRSLSKTDASYKMAQALETDSTLERPQIIINALDPHISYLINAIKYACRL
jgi:putative ATP-dependent endonuclease of OLD family